MKQLQLCIYINETDMSGDFPLYEAIVRRFLHLQIAGATVAPALMGYGKHGKVHRKRLFGLSDDRPIVVTAIDEESRIRSLLPQLRAMVTEGLITIQEVQTV